MRSLRACGLLLVLGIALAGCEAPATATGPEVAIPTLAMGPMAQDPNGCGTWSCAMSDCGYDTATDPRGACCMAPPPDGEQGSWDKPSCEDGYTAMNDNDPSCWSGSGCHGACITDDHESGETDCFGAIGWWHCTSVSFGSC